MGNTNQRKERKTRTRKVHDRLNRRLVELTKNGDHYRGEINGKPFVLDISMECSSFTSSVPRAVYTNSATGYRTDNLEAAVASIEPAAL